MKLPKCSMSRVFGLGSIALAVAACSEPTAPETERAAAVANVGQRVGRYVVLMKQGDAGGVGGGLTANALGTSTARLGGTVERAHPDIGVLQVRGLTAVAAAELRRQAGVEAVAEDRRIQWLPPRAQRAHATRRLTRESDQRGAAFFDDFQWNIKKIRAPQAWDDTPQGQNVTVCILDTGVDHRHIDLRGKVRNDIGASFVATERADRDLDTHGTMMAAIASSNGLGVASVAPDARLCSVKVLDRTGSGTFGDVAAGMMYVGEAGRIDGSARVDVANMSLGATVPRNDPDVQTLIQMLQRAADIGTRRGVLFVASAGNDGLNFNNNPGLVHLPGGLANVMSIGATGPRNQLNFDRLASYTNKGNTAVDLFAPGGEFAFANNVLEDLILSACSPSTRIPGLEVCADQVTYVFSAGTSQSTAHVSGAAAVIESNLSGNQTPAQLIDCLLRFADDQPSPLLSSNGRLNVFRSARCGTGTA